VSKQKKIVYVKLQITYLAMGDKEDNQKAKIQKPSYNEPQSPYYLNSFDHPRYIIGLVILNEDNYQNWGIFTTNALIS